MKESSVLRAPDTSDVRSLVAAPLTNARIAAIVVAILSLVVAAATIGNGFTLDDIPIIAKIDRVHSLRSIGSLFSQTYWPPSEGASLYRR